MKVCSVVFFAVLICMAASEKNPSANYVEAFIKDLAAKGYDPKTPPEGWNGYGTPVKVYSTMYILNIHEVDDLSLDYAAQFYFRQSWNDSRLQYNNYDVDFITLRDMRNIWTPDLFFVEEKDGKMHNLLGPNIFCRVNPRGGQVLCSQRLSIKFRCPMNFRKYPHDTQKCTFNIESYGYTLDTIELNWNNSKPDPLMASPDIVLLDYDLTETKYSFKDSTFTFGTYRALQVHLTFRRKLGFFMTKLYVPFIILVLVAWLSYWIKIKERLLRLSLLLVVLFLMLTISMDISDYIPPSPYTKGSDVWIAVCESLVFSSFLELILVSLIAAKEKKMNKRHRKSDAEMPMVTDCSEKVTGTNADSLASSANIVASRVKGNRLSYRIDFVSRVLYPLIFLLFNVVYWSIYCSG